MKHIVRGAGRIDLAALGPRRIRLEVLTMGAMIVAGSSLETGDLIFAGEGRHTVKAAIEGGSLFVVPFDKNNPTVLDIPELRGFEAGWTDEPSLTDLSPRPLGAVSPEIQAVMDRMNRNAIIREQAMLRALGATRQG